MAETAKRMGRPPRSPPRSSGCRCPWRPWQSVWRRRACGQGTQRLLRYRGEAARYGAADGDFSHLRLSLAGGRLPRSPARFQRAADREPRRDLHRADRRRKHDGGRAVSGRYRRCRSFANGRGQLDVLALLTGEFTVKRYRKKGARTWLQAGNPAFENIEINENSGFEMWGLIAKSIRML